MRRRLMSLVRVACCFNCRTVGCTDDRGRLEHIFWPFLFRLWLLVFRFAGPLSEGVERGRLVFVFSGPTCVLEDTLCELNIHLIQRGG